MTKRRLQMSCLLALCIFWGSFRLSHGQTATSPSLPEPSFHIARGTRRILQPEHFFPSQTLSSLSPFISDQNIYLSLSGDCSICTTTSHVSAGQIERTNKPRAISTIFTLHELKSDSVSFQHSFSAGTELVSLSVTISSTNSTAVPNDTITLYIQPFDGNIYLANHSCLLMLEDSAALVQSQHLRALTDFSDQNPVLTYRFESPLPVPGALEVYSPDQSDWVSIEARKEANSISQVEIEAGHVRYVFPALETQFITEQAFPFQLSSSQLAGPNASLCVIIVPALKPLLSVETSVINVVEGQAVVVQAADFHLDLSSQIDLTPWGVDTTAESLDMKLVISSPPQFGTLQLNNVPLNLLSIVFSDIEEGRLTYVHDDSENFADHLDFWVEAVSVNDLPLALPDQTSLLQLNFTITPVNDNPPVARQLEPVNPLEGSSVVVTSAMIGISDADLDTRPEDINISIEPSGTVGTPNGHFAYLTNTTDPILEFKYSEILSGLIVFKYGEDLSKDLDYVQGARVSDGVHSVPWVIKVSAVSISLNVTLVQLSGQSCVATIDVLQGQTYVTLPSSAFLVDISEEEHRADVVINVVTPPMLGQLLSEEGSELGMFSLMAVEAGDIVYSLLDSQLQVDFDSMQLQFFVGHGNSSIVDFGICIKSLPHPFLVKNNLMELLEGEVRTLTPELLLATQSRSQESSPTELRYTVKQPPMHGLLINRSTEDTSSSLSSFTQADIDKGIIAYLNTEEPHIATQTDKFSFQLSNSHYQLKPEYNFSIQLLVTELKVADTGFVVRENHSHVFTPKEFYAVAPAGYSVEVYIIDQPQDGDLVIRRDGAPLDIFHPQTIDLSDVQDGYLQYIHDGDKKQESPMDNFRFTFLARHELDSTTDLILYSGIFNITIELVNDNEPREVRTYDLGVIEGSTTLITPANLWFSDEDAGYDISLLQYTITLAPTLGIICLTQEACDNDVAVTTWNQSDIMALRLFYKHNRNFITSTSNNEDPNIIGNDAVVFTVSDGLHENIHNVFIFHISKVVLYRREDSPVKLEEGGLSFVTKANLDYELTWYQTAPPDGAYKYNVTKQPKHGSLMRFAMFGFLPITAFTGADLSLGLAYAHDDSNTITDSFTFEVTVDGYNTASSVDTVEFVITPVDDDRPFLFTKKLLPFPEGLMDSKHFIADVLEARDNDTASAADIVYLVIQPPADGIIQKRPDQTSNFQSIPVGEFTQDDINKENVRYERTNKSSLYDSFTFSLANYKSGMVINHNPTVYSMDIVILPTVLSITFGSIVVQEGGVAFLSPDDFVVIHPYLANEDYEITIHDQPLHGTLVVNINAPSARKISTEDLRQQQVYYVHDGSENFEDHFTFVLDSMESETTVETFMIKIEHVNDHFPTMQNNKHLQLYAGQTVDITPDILLAADVDRPTSNLTYNFTLTPEQLIDGHFAFAGMPYQTILSFTQEDINNGHVVFVDTHDYGGTRNLSFTLTDGAKSIHGVFVVTALEVCLGKELLKNLTVPFGGSAVISNTTLSYVSNGPNDPEQITYTLSSTQYGILTRDGLPERITSFTKAEVNKNKIRYQHLATDIWEAFDVIHLRGSTPLTLKDTPIELNVSIVLPSQPGSPFAVDKNLSVSEGGEACLDLSVLDARNFRYHSWKAEQQLYSLEDTFLIYRVLTLPSYGDLLVERVPAVALSNFSQQQLTDHQVCYRSNGTYEESGDSVGYTVCVLASDGAALACINNTLDIDINLYNDEEPILVQSSLLRLDAVSGFPSNITRSILEVTDRDNSSQEIIFFVTESPANGTLLLGDAPLQESFTQEDINSGRLIFNSTAPGNFTATFKFTDRDTSAVVGVDPLTDTSVTLVVNVAAHFLTLSQVGTLRYHQNKPGGRITPLVLDSETNGSPSETVFIVTRKPSHGRLLRREQEVENFTQLDIDRRLVDYMTNPSGVHVSNDSFEVVVANRDAHVVGHHLVEIVVEAVGSVPDSVALDAVMYQPLPADLLNLRTYSLENKIWPTIRITSELRYGAVSLYFGMRKDHYIAVSEFDYDDLEKQIVYYTWLPHQDNVQVGGKYYEALEGEVIIDGLPPGRFSLTLNLTAPFGAASPPTSSLPPSSTPTAATSSVPSNQEVSTSPINYSLILPVVILAMVTGVLFCIFIGFCCCQYQKINRKMARKGAGSILSFPSAHHRPPARHLSPARLGQSPVLVQSPIMVQVPAGCVNQSDTPSFESSTASLEMMTLSQVPPPHYANNLAPASHFIQSSGYSSAINSAEVTPVYDAEDSAQFSEEEFDSIRVSSSLHQPSPVPPSSSWYHPTTVSLGKTENPCFVRGTDQRASSPVRRLRANSPMRRNSKPYSSMSRVGAGSVSSKTLRELTADLQPSMMPALADLRDSDSTLPCESSCESKAADDTPVALQKLVTLPAGASGGDAPHLFRTTHPVLRNSEYWV